MLAAMMGGMGGMGGMGDMDDMSEEDMMVCHCPAAVIVIL